MFKAFSFSLTVLALTSFVSAQPKDALQRISDSLGVIGAFFLVVLVYFITAGWVTIVAALLPEWVQRKVQKLQTQSTKIFSFGLLITIILLSLSVALALVSKSIPPVAIFAFISLLLLFTLASIGWVPVAWLLGQKVVLTCGWGKNDLPVVLIGALVLQLTACMPIVGWAIVLYWAIVSVGLWAVKS